MKRGRPAGSVTTAIGLPNKRARQKTTPFVKLTIKDKQKYIMSLFVKEGIPEKDNYILSDVIDSHNNMTSAIKDKNVKLNIIKPIVSEETFDHLSELAAAMRQ